VPNWNGKLPVFCDRCNLNLDITWTVRPG